jgi:hypothetical protein
MTRRRIATVLGCVIIAACGGATHSSNDNGGGGDGGADSSGSSSGSSGGSSGSSSGADASSGGSGSSSGGIDSGSGGGSGSSSGGQEAGLPDGGDPVTCAQAAQFHTYVGCDYWPTVTANQVWSIFDYAVVVANAGSTVASVTVTGPMSTNQTTAVNPGELATIYLPWVPALKGADGDNCGTVVPFTASVLAAASAYHLVSTVPVIVYQFNALEYAGQGGPPGKSWSSCPGSTACASSATEIGCYSFTNDASLLFPTTAMTGNYRVTGHEGWTTGAVGPTLTITATTDNTTVNVKLSSTAQILAGTGITATAASGTLTLSMNAGDVAELVADGTDASDFSGSLVQASLPVQVITGLPCLDVPDTAAACDHIEESNFPAETLGQDYIVAQPTGPKANAVGQLVRIYGNVDGTTLTYDPSTPTGCPTTIDAGQVVECGIVAQDFEVKGSNAFAVSIFTQGASVVDPTDVSPNQQGDPDQSLPVPVEQYRSKYVFLAPTDYEESYAVIVEPTGTTVTLDGTVATETPTPVGTSAYGVLRVTLGPGNAGAHVLTASSPVGLQVMGYGSYTSYQYPGGLDLAQIAPPPM